MNEPSVSRIPKRSASPSVARPASALFSRTAFLSGARFSSDGSGPVPSKEHRAWCGWLQRGYHCRRECGRASGAGTWTRRRRSCPWLFQHIETDHAVKLVKVRPARIDGSEIVLDFVRGGRDVFQRGGAPSMSLVTSGSAGPPFGSRKF